MGLSATVEEGETLSDEGRGMVEEIRQNAQWLLHLSENILSVTRFSEEGVVIEKSDEVVEEIVGSAIRRFRKNCGTDIPIAVTKPEEILLVPMDATLIEQVLLNLLTHALLFTDRGQKVLCAVREQLVKNKKVSLEFTVLCAGKRNSQLCKGKKTPGRKSRFT